MSANLMISMLIMIFIYGKEIHDLIWVGVGYKLHDTFPRLENILQISFTVSSILRAYKISAFLEARSEVSYYFGKPTAIHIMIKLIHLEEIVQQ